MTKRVGTIVRANRGGMVALAVAAAALALGLATGQEAAAESRAPSFLAAGGPAKPTRAWAAFCASAPDDCDVNLREPAVIRYSRTAWADLVAVNAAVNEAVVARTDFDHWGVSDRWDYPTDGVGDCEDIQLEKRRRLVALGYPARAMRMAVVLNPEGEGHAVLLVRTDRGDYVLDNRIGAVLPWWQARYTWVKREGEDGPQWVALGNVKPAVETAGNMR
jgi:predicted transglutaminase-like cysteine proteinase